MVIAIETGLAELGTYLRQKGYRVVNIESRVPCDAIIYQTTPMHKISVPASVTAGTGNSSGVFLVCVNGRSPEEIERILQQKTYYNLF